MKVKLKGGTRSEAVNAVSLDYRELYINYLQGNESIILKNSNDDIVYFRPYSPESFKEVTAVSDSNGVITPPPHMEGYHFISGSYTHNSIQQPLLSIGGQLRTAMLVENEANIVAFGGNFPYLYYENHPNSTATLIYGIDSE